MRDVLVCSWRHIPSLWVSLPTVKLSFLDAWATRPGALKQSASRRDSFRKWTLWVVVSDGMVPVVTDTASSFTVVVKEQKKKKKRKPWYALLCIFQSLYMMSRQFVSPVCFISPAFCYNRYKYDHLWHKCRKKILSELTSTDSPGWNFSVLVSSEPTHLICHKVATAANHYPFQKHGTPLTTYHSHSWLQVYSKTNIY